jgi:hypothetical protein
MNKLVQRQGTKLEDEAVFDIWHTDVVGDILDDLPSRSAPI